MRRRAPKRPGGPRLSHNQVFTLSIQMSSSLLKISLSVKNEWGERSSVHTPIHTHASELIGLCTVIETLYLATSWQKMWVDYCQFHIILFILYSSWQPLKNISNFGGKNYRSINKLTNHSQWNPIRAVIKWIQLLKRSYTLFPSEYTTQK